MSATAVRSVSTPEEILNHGVQSCETAVKKAQSEIATQSVRLRECIGKELEFKVKRGPNARVRIPERRCVLDGHKEEDWPTGSSMHAGLMLEDHSIFAARVMTAGINLQGRSYVVVAVGATQEVCYAANLRPGREYQLFLDRIQVVRILD